MQGRAPDAHVRRVQGGRVTARFETLAAAEAAGVTGKELVAGTAMGHGGVGWLQHLFTVAAAHS